MPLFLGGGVAMAVAEDAQNYHNLWASSHHAKAMQVATEDTVLGDFEEATLTVQGVTSRFYKKDGHFWVQTEGAQGKLQDYKIEYTFGLTPLQQYLVRLSGGKYQVLPLSWDSRPKADGGQRWFHIYGEAHIPAHDRLHWTQPLQNWNGMCADCHSTGLKRDYQPEKDTFSTRWEQINVGCASCHGSEPDTVEFKQSLSMLSPDKAGGSWFLPEGADTVQWQGVTRNQRQIEVCAACHSQRTPLTDGFSSMDYFLDAFSPTLITPPNYFKDGQIKEEVYVWGSFLQSKMYQKGVVCSDCHEPHSLKLKAQGNDLCLQCHQPQKFNAPSHHHHKTDTEGALCVNCHMTSRRYMGVDDRRDHSFRIPHPEISHKIGSPDACTSCHQDQKPIWAIQEIIDWRGDKDTKEDIFTPVPTPSYGEVLNDVAKGLPGAEKALRKMIQDSRVPVILRASGYSLLVNYPGQATENLLRKAINSDEPLIRLGAVQAFASLPIDVRLSHLPNLLNDRYRAIRVAVVHMLSESPSSKIPKSYKVAYDKARQEFLQATRQTQWRGEGRVNLAMHLWAQGKSQAAKEENQAAIRIDPFFPAGFVNLADIYRAEGQEDKSAEVIDQGLAHLPMDGGLNFSKALSLVRRGKPQAALSYFDRAVEAEPGQAYYAYVYAVALGDLGKSDMAVQILERALEVSENDLNLNYQLLLIYRQNKQWRNALKYAEKMRDLVPKNQMIQNLIRELRTVVRAKEVVLED
ncbi:tetratricopeptide repeat protein [Paremcibacter congregatus]|uniref:tetratricopeptide repeat protein n=1 Tax=Paremcibacter congregatus TaxID=2043170 RepID=UPI003A95C43B